MKSHVMKPTQKFQAPPEVGTNWWKLCQDSHLNMITQLYYWPFECLVGYIRRWRSMDGGYIRRWRSMEVNGCNIFLKAPNKNGCGKDDKNKDLVDQ